MHEALHIDSVSCNMDSSVQKLSVQGLKAIDERTGLSLVCNEAICGFCKLTFLVVY